MNPMLAEALTSIVRSILKIGAGYLVARGVWAPNDANNYVAAAALAIVGIGWSYWQTYRSRVKLLTALTMPPGATEADVTATVAAGGPSVPSVTTPPTVVPTGKGSL